MWPGQVKSWPPSEQGQYYRSWDLTGLSLSLPHAGSSVLGKPRHFIQYILVIRPKKKNKHIKLLICGKEANNVQNIYFETNLLHTNSVSGLLQGTSTETPSDFHIFHIWFFGPPHSVTIVCMLFKHIMKILGKFFM